MFERFTPDARAVVVDAQHHARRLGHGYIGCEHLLLALTASPSPVAAKFAAAGATPAAVERVIVQQIGMPDRGGDKAALASLGIDLDEVRKAVEANFGSGALDPRPTVRRWRRLLLRRRQRRTCGPLSGHIPFTPRAKKCLELSLRESLRLKQRTIGAEHVALAFLRDDETMAARVLHQLGVDKPGLRQALTDSLRRSA